MEFNNQCIWTLTVTYNDEAKTVSYPLTCEFNIDRSSFSEAKRCTINIYNLAPSTRLSEHFRHDAILDEGKVKIVEFSAGYNNDIVTCFRGIIIEAYSDRRGTDVITTIQAMDEGVSSVNKQLMSITFKKGTTFVEAFDNISNTLKYVQPTIRGVLEGVFKTDTTFYGTPLQILNQITNNHTFIDNSEIITLNDNECLAIEPLLLSAQTGLLEVPKARNFWITARMIFNPHLKVGQRVELKTTFLNTYNGIYKVYGINHQGIISGAVGGQRITTVNLMIKDSLPNSNENTTQQTERQGLKVVEGIKVYTPENPFVDNIYKYIRDNNGNIPRQNINPLVSWDDMLGHDNKPYERYSQLNPQILANCKVIADQLYNFITTSSLNGQKFTIVSGWRSLENNTAAGGKRESRHRYGSAIDLKFNSISTYKAFWNVFYPQWDGFTYQYIINGQYYIHIQTGLGVNGTRRL